MARLPPEGHPTRERYSELLSLARRPCCTASLEKAMEQARSPVWPSTRQEIFTAQRRQAARVGTAQSLSWPFQLWPAASGRKRCCTALAPAPMEPLPSQVSPLTCPATCMAQLLPEALTETARCSGWPRQLPAGKKPFSIISSCRPMEVFPMPDWFLAVRTFMEPPATEVPAVQTAAEQFSRFRPQPQVAGSSRCSTACRGGAFRAVSATC